MESVIDLRGIRRHEIKTVGIRTADDNREIYETGIGKLVFF